MARNPDFLLFNKIFETYDKLRFQTDPCERLVAHAGISDGEKALDVACGTGWATLAAARAVGRTGHVTGVDIAEKALSMAQRKVKEEGLDNVDFDEQDGHHLKFEDCVFDGNSSDDVGGAPWWDHRAADLRLRKNKCEHDLDR